MKKYSSKQERLFFRTRFLYCVLLIFISTSILQGQPGQWTWMHGSNTSNSFGVFGAQGVAAAGNMPPAVYEACEWTDNQGRFWVFGGIDVHNILTGFDCYNALWMYDPASNMWTWMKGGSTRNNPGVYGVKGVAAPANTPGARTFATMTWVDNQNNLWMYGGRGYDVTGAVQGALGDLWKYNITTNQWTWVSGSNTSNPVPVHGTKGIPAVANYPGAREESSACWIENNNLWFFGGLASAGAMNDTWRYNIATDQWTWMHGTTAGWTNGVYGTKGVPAANNVPSGRMVYAKWKDKNGGFWMFGGSSANGYENDLWKYDVASNMWTWIRGSNTAGSNGTSGTLCTQSSTFDPPAAYENRACWVDSCENFWMFGGRQANAQNEFWSYNVPTNQWTKIHNAGAGNYGVINTAAATNLPPDRFGALPFTDNQGNLWMFGGGQSIGGNYYNDLWKFVIDTNCIPWCSLVQNPTANFTASVLSGCVPLTVNFTNTSSNSNAWTWSFGDGNTSNAQNPSNTYTNPGQYTVTLISTDGSQSDTLVMTNYVTVYANAIAAYTASNDTLCTNQSVTFTNTSTNSNASNWNFGNGNTSTATSPTTTYPTAGNYTVTLIAQNANGCPDTLTMPITVVPSFTQNQAASICVGQTYTLPSGTIVNTSGIYNDTLTSINGCDSIINTTLTVTPFLTSNQAPVLCQGNTFLLPDGTSTGIAGTYIDTVTSTGGCDSVITTVLTVNQHTSSNQTNSICTGSSFTLPDGTIVTAAGTYTDTVPNSNGCDSVITIVLNVNPLPTANITGTNPSDTILQGQSTTITASGGGTYSWTPTTGLNPITGNTVTATPNQTTSYCVMVTDTNGCTDSSCITIYVKEIPCPEENNLAVPNAFSPNNDGVNEEFCLQGWVPCIESFVVTIFDRWGEKVFESSDPNFCWDGNYKGTIMDAQVFVYYIKARFVNIDKAIVKKGNISLIR